MTIWKNHQGNKRNHYKCLCKIDIKEVNFISIFVLKYIEDLLIKNSKMELIQQTADSK